MLEEDVRLRRVQTGGRLMKAQVPLALVLVALAAHAAAASPCVEGIARCALNDDLNWNGDWAPPMTAVPPAGGTPVSNDPAAPAADPIALAKGLQALAGALAVSAVDGVAGAATGM